MLGSPGKYIREEIPDSTIHAEPFKVTELMVYDAMVTADSLGKIHEDADLRWPK